MSVLETPTPTPQPAVSKRSPALRRGWLSGWKFYLLAALLLLLVRSVIFDWNVVPSGSMKPTILEGDYIFVNKMAYDLKVPFLDEALVHWSGPRRGDIVVFTPPGETDLFVKRVVGVPGDVIEMRNNRLFVNNQPASYGNLEPTDIPVEERAEYRFAQESVAGRAHAVMFAPQTFAPSNFASFVVPEGNYFMLGDNRDNSKDSRYFGFVPRERIIGRAWSVGVSLEPGHGPRWQRFFSALA